jgi:hypothetical protein
MTMMVKRASDEISDLVCLDEGMAELALLMPGWQARALADAAQQEGITAGQYLRRLLDRHLPRPARCGNNRLGFDQ